VLGLRVKDGMEGLGLRVEDGIYEVGLRVEGAGCRYPPDDLQGDRARSHVRPSERDAAWGVGLRDSG
jgi:hypothetical protein